MFYMHMLYLQCRNSVCTYDQRMKLGKALTRTIIDIRGTFNDKMKEKCRTGSRLDRNACTVLVYWK